MLIGTAVGVTALLALLAIPVTLRFRIAWDRTLEQDVRLLWAFGLVDARLRPLQTATGIRRDEAARRPGRSASGKRRGRGANALGALRDRRFRRRLARFLGDLWRAVGKRDVRLRIRIGLDDPADTGRLWALLGPVAGLLAAVQEVSISLEPEFAGEAFALEGNGSLRLVPLRVVCLTAGLSLSPAFWQGVRALRAGAP